jgi:hypothetical protein
MHMAHREYHIDGYTYTTESQAAFDAVIGKLPKEVWSQLPPAAQVLLAFVIVCRDPAKYVGSDGYLKKSLFVTINGIVGYTGRPTDGSNWPKIVNRRGWVCSNGAPASIARFRIVKNESLRSVLQDIELYYQDPNALTPEQWTIVHRKAAELCEDPEVGYSGPVVAAIAYKLSRLAGACHP